MFAAVGAICAWSYKVGSARLGVVDLFACEICTLCRVTTVIDTVGRLMSRLQQGDESASKTEASPRDGSTNDDRTNAPQSMQFTSVENYFPVFESNSRDLQSLEARVVINITSFYTYMKTVRDLMRVAAVRKAGRVTVAERQVDQLHADTWHNAMRDVIYMLYLALEAGRSSVGDLVEYEPEQAERTIIVLLSELKAYQFLVQEFRGSKDMRESRLLLRWETYRKDFRDLNYQVTTQAPIARRTHDAAVAQHLPVAEISIAKLTRDIWEGAEKLLPDFYALFKSTEALVQSKADKPQLTD